MTHDTSNRVEIAVVDTNVFLKNPYAPFQINAQAIAVPFHVLQALDTLQDAPGKNGRNSRKAVSIFEALRLKGNLETGVPLDEEGDTILFVPRIAHETDSTEDHMLLETARHFHQNGKQTILCTQDINLRLQATQIGITSQEISNTPHILPHELAPVLIQKVSSKELKTVTRSRVLDLLDEQPSYRNQYIRLESQNNPENYRLFRWHGGGEVSETYNQPILGSFGPKNAEQMMALDLLMDENVKLVSLIGRAGTGKTFLILLAGLAQMFHHRRYRRIMVTRPTVSLGPDIGFLPGDVNEKLESWMQPVYDNISMITAGSSRKAASYMSVEELRKNDQLCLQAITYMRGRSLPQQYLFVDEAQNLTPLELKTLITRAGHGTKVILAGDPDQIDTPYLSYDSNGLIVTTKRFKGDSLFGVVHLQKSERSDLAQRASELL